MSTLVGEKFPKKKRGARLVPGDDSPRAPLFPILRGAYCPSRPDYGRLLTSADIVRPREWRPSNPPWWQVTGLTGGGAGCCSARPPLDAGIE